MKIKSKEITNFLGKLNDTERIFLKHTLELSNSVQRLLKDNVWLTKDVFCKMINIAEIDYDDFVSGNRNYDLMDISKINALHAECERRKVKPIVSVG